MDKYDVIDSRATSEGHFRADGSEKLGRSQIAAKKRARALRVSGVRNARHYFCDICEMFHVGRFSE